MHIKCSSYRQDLGHLTDALQNVLSILDNLSDEDFTEAENILGDDFYDRITDGVQDLTFNVDMNI